MAQLEFKSYLNALFAGKGKTGATAYQLSNDELKEINSFLVKDSLIGTLGTDLAVSETSTSNVVILKNIGQGWNEKTGPGMNGNYEKGRYATETFNWNAPYFQAVGFTEADKKMKVPQAAAIKLEKASVDYNNAFEAESWKKLETHLKTADSKKITKDLLDKTITDKEVYEIVIGLGTALMQHKNDDDGIDKIPKDKIIIHVKPEVFDRISLAGLVGNRAEISFVGGQYSIGIVGGYKIIGNPYLDNMQAMAGATFSALSMISVNAANIDRLAPTNDIGLYYEAMSLFGIAYKDCFRTVQKA
ncbi:hypothetical protein [Metamycoplasma buccale]|uniref:hypothetical protein n=1 Tax=Metamycoplasma buccale TaxID=55602 RepID=UPI00398E3693